jgi:SAM-dependent methyltransferase/DNA-directed RNA polymerase subunit RPC12/RpoP
MPVPTVSPRYEHVQYACPGCRRPVEIGQTLDQWRCPTCCFQVVRRGKVISFTGTGVNEWQKFFDDKARSPIGDTISAIEYNTSLQNYYIINAFRNICANIHDRATILDAGCGNGLFWQKFLAPRPVVGIDYSLAMCELAEARGMTAYQADIQRLPFADEQFDLVYCAEIIQYIADFPALLREFARVCRSGGRVVVSTINRTSVLQLGVRKIRSAFPRQDMPHSFRYFRRTADDIAGSADGLPLTVKTVAWTHFPIPWLHRAKSPTRPMDWLAWNVFVDFVKRLV